MKACTQVTYGISFCDLNIPYSIRLHTVSGIFTGHLYSHAHPHFLLPWYAAAHVMYCFTSCVSEGVVKCMLFWMCLNTLACGP
jgi:hypothetical protein